MTKQSLTNPEKKPVYDDPAHLAAELGLRSSFVADSAEIQGWTRTPSGTLEVSLLLRREGHAQQYHLATLLHADSISIAKEILRKLEPSALDPDTLLHNTVQRIDRNVDSLLEKTKKKD